VEFNLCKLFPPEGIILNSKCSIGGMCLQTYE
jgi:hypothetical protein